MIRSTFAVPVVIASVSTAGLVATLTGDGVRDALSWAALAVPVAAVGWAMRNRPTRSFKRPGTRRPHKVGSTSEIRE